MDPMMVFFSVLKQRRVTRPKYVFLLFLGIGFDIVHKKGLGLWEGPLQMFDLPDLTLI